MFQCYNAAALPLPVDILIGNTSPHPDPSCPWILETFSHLMWKLGYSASGGGSGEERSQQTLISVCISLWDF